MFDLESINKHRLYIFGIATLWIALFHSYYLDLSSYSALSFLNIGATLEGVNRLGSGAVDIFLVLSGIGLYYSFSKTPDVLLFYRKRLVRVFPSSFIVALAIAIIGGVSGVLAFLAKVTFLEFYLIRNADIRLWYVSTILLLYLLFPLFYKIYGKLKYLGAALIILVSVIITLVLFKVDKEAFTRLEIMLTRVPVFICGMILGSIMKKGIKISNVKALLICLFGTVYFLIMMLLTIIIPEEYEFLRHYLYLPMAVSLVIIIAFIRSKISSKILTKPLELLGKFSLELYLIHQYLYESMDVIFKSIYENQLLYSAVIFVISLALAVILKLSVDFVVDKIQKKTTAPKTA